MAALSVESSGSVLERSLVVIGLLFLVGWLIVWVYSPSNTTVIFKDMAIACQRPETLTQVGQMARDNAGVIALSFFMAKNNCDVFKAGEQVKVIGKGGFLWWRTQIEHEGKRLWVDNIQMPK